MIFTEVIVEADTPDEAETKAREIFTKASDALDAVVELMGLIPHPSIDWDDPLLVSDVVTCDVCDKVEYPDNLTTDWNGETGCHLSCEAAR